MDNIIYELRRVERQFPGLRPSPSSLNALLPGCTMTAGRDVYDAPLSRHTTLEAAQTALTTCAPTIDLYADNQLANVTEYAIFEMEFNSDLEEYFDTGDSYTSDNFPATLCWHGREFTRDAYGWHENENENKE